MVLAGAALWLVWDSDRFSGEKIIVRGKVFRIELAETAQKRELGLGGRDALCEGCGMVFVFAQSGRYPFWMKGMRFPLDIIWWQSEDGRIVHIEKNISPDFKGTLDPQAGADRVLEIGAGSADRYGIQNGDQIIFQK